MSNLLPVNVNADISDSSNKIIVDLFGPASKQLGIALGNVFGLINTVTMPVQFMNEYAARNFRNVGEKISEIPEEKIKPVEPEIAIPLIEKLSYTSNEELAEIYATLLSNASNIDKADVVHPGFINKINSMAPDEARLLALLKEKKTIYYIDIKAVNQKESAKLSLSIKLTGIERELNISAKQLIMHLENFVSLSILVDKEGVWKIDEEGYEKLTDLYQDNINQYEENIKNGQYREGYNEIRIDKSHYEITTIGFAFMEACINS